MSVELHISKEEERMTLSAFEKMIRLKNVPQKIFDTFQKVFGGTSLEVVPIRYNKDGNIEVFMMKRPSTDTYWPGEYHVPGTMVFAWDWTKGNGFDSAWERIKKKEVAQNNDSSLMPVSTLYLDTKRGGETACVNIIVFKGPTSNESGEWFAIDNIPSNIIDHHKPIIFEGIHDFVAAIKSGYYLDTELGEMAIENMISQISNLKRQ